MASLPNYLQTARKRHSLSQEEVAFLMGFCGESKASRVSRYENFVHELDLRTALGFETIFGEAVRDLFSGIREEVEQKILERAKVLRHRRSAGANPRRDELVDDLIARIPQL